MFSRSQPRHAFTLVELLVVIGIVGVLVGLLLPAIQRTREAARRHQCVNNLFQISTALQNYEATHEVFPPGVVNPTGPISNTAKGYHLSWLVQILPFLEQRNAFNKTNFSMGAYDDANATVRTHGIHSLLCPSASSSASRASSAATDYAACHHDIEAPIDITNNGVFYLNSNTRLDGVKDGMFCTIFLGEKRTFAGPTLGWMSGTNATLRNAGTRINGTSVFMPAPGDDEAAAEEGASPANLFVGGFGGPHPGGANFAMGDGSVRFLHNSLSPIILRQLANRADGGLIDTTGW